MTQKHQAAMIAKLHIAKTQLGMDDDSYRAILSQCGGGKSSSKDLTERQLEDCLTRMKQLGFVPTRPKRAGQTIQGRGVADAQGLLAKIDALLAEAGYSTAYADGIAQCMYGVARVVWLKPYQLRSVAAALTKAAQKAGRAVR